MKIKSQKNNQKWYIGAVLVLILLAAGLYYLFIVKDSSTANQEKAASDTKIEQKTDSQDTQETKSDDVKKDQLPDNVKPDDVKDYTTLVENEKYKIRELNDSYTITLYAIINNPSQYDTYKDQLKQYKQEALDYMKSKDIDTTKVKITYEPDEATNL
jgi:hypothetical protein